MLTDISVNCASPNRKWMIFRLSQYKNPDEKWSHFTIILKFLNHVIGEWLSFWLGCSSFAYSHFAYSQFTYTEISVPPTLCFCATCRLVKEVHPGDVITKRNANALRNTKKIKIITSQFRVFMSPAKIYFR